MGRNDTQRTTSLADFERIVVEGSPKDAEHFFGV